MYKKILSYLYKIIPYVIILLFSCLGCFLLFKAGINRGDDFNFHIPNILEQYKTIKSNHYLSPISGYLGIGLGSGNRLFYSPLPHLTVTILALFLNLFNGSIILAYKVTIILSIFISGIFMYRFSMHFTNNNKIASIIASCIFVLYPYRLFDAFCRFAFAETYSFMFLPLFFMGLYDICHLEKDDIKILPFVETILGGSLLFLSHNLTAFYSFLFGIIYLLCNIKNIIKLVKNKKYISYCALSIVLLLGISSIAMFSQSELMQTNLYNISNRVRMWTDVETVLSRTGEEFDYSGFLNIVYLHNSFNGYLSLSKIYLEIIFYLIFSILFVVCSNLLNKIKNNKLKISFKILVTILYISLILIVSRRFEYIIGSLIFVILYYLVILFYHNENLNKPLKEDKIYKNVLFYFSFVSIFILIFMMENKTIWTILPALFLNIQFPWRLWALVQLFIPIVIALIIHYFGFHKILSLLLTILVGFLMVTNQPLLEKRMMSEYHRDDWWVYEIKDELLDRSSSLGYNKEYIPQVFLDNDYQTKYDNSLYKQIYTKIRYNTDAYEDYFLKPVFLEGNGTITINDAFSPNYDMNIIVENDNALIQMPLFYYPGYQIEIINNKTKQKIKPINIDGLVAFNLDSGTYQVKTHYIGTPLRIFSKIFFTISIIGTLVMLIYGFYIEIFKKKYLKKIKTILNEYQF